MLKIFVFDVDGTLTPPREPMEKDFVKIFFNFCKNNIVYLCSGSDWGKISNQVPKKIIKRTKGVFTCSGNAFWNNKGEEVLSLRNDFDAPDKLIKDLELLLESSNFPIKTKKHIDYRTGMINFSVVGRGCSTKERAEYKEWDKMEEERKLIVETLSSKYPNIDFNIGGEISIDIHPKGNDKSRSIRLIREWHKDESISICFMGDKLWPGGNDYPILDELTDADGFGEVSSYRDTMNLIK